MTVESRKRRTTRTITTTGVGKKLGIERQEVTVDMSLVALVAAMVFCSALTNTHKDVLHIHIKANPRTKYSREALNAASAALTVPRDSFQHYTNATHTHTHAYF